MDNGIPSTVVVETRVKIEIQATLHKYFATRGLTITNRSELIRTSLDLYANLLVSKDFISPFTSAHESYNYLLSQGIHFGQRNSKANKSIIKTLQAESLELMAQDDTESLPALDKDKYNEALDVLSKSDALSNKRTKQDND